MPGNEATNGVCTAVRSTVFSGVSRLTWLSCPVLGYLFKLILMSKAVSEGYTVFQTDF